jgi:hypothetical protein
MVLGDVPGWVGDPFSRIHDLAFYLLALAIALRTAESALIGLVWRNILAAAYPRGSTRRQLHGAVAHELQLGSLDLLMLGCRAARRPKQVEPHGNAEWLAVRRRGASPSATRRAC